MGRCGHEHGRENCGALARGDRAATRQRERALHLLGFAELQRGFWLRPDNIEADIGAIRGRLYALGLETQAVVCGCTSLDAATEAAVDALWDGVALNQGYRATQERLQRWLDGAARLPIDQAARESFFLGGAAIRQLVYDPLLPEPMVDAALRLVLSVDTAEVSAQALAQGLKGPAIGQAIARARERELALTPIGAPQPL